MSVLDVMHGTLAGKRAGCTCMFCQVAGLPNAGRQLSEAERLRRRQEIIERARKWERAN